jgi:hypothetical protein
MDSTAGIRGFESLAHYTTAKTGAIGLMRALVNELGKYRIRVNVVISTACDTNVLHSDVCYGLFFGDGRSPSRHDLSATPQSIHTLPVDVVTPDDIANAAAFLTSEEARYVTGTELRVDAGFCEKQLSAYVASPESAPSAYPLSGRKARPAFRPPLGLGRGASQGQGSDQARFIDNHMHHMYPKNIGA